MQCRLRALAGEHPPRGFAARLGALPRVLDERLLLRGRRERHIAPPALKLESTNESAAANRCRDRDGQGTGCGLRTLALDTLRSGEADARVAALAAQGNERFDDAVRARFRARPIGFQEGP